MACAARPRFSDVLFSVAGYCKAEAFAFNPFRDLVLSSLIEGIILYAAKNEAFRNV